MTFLVNITFSCQTTPETHRKNNQNPQIISPIKFAENKHFLLLNLHGIYLSFRVRKRRIFDILNMK